jgi:anti-sigma B factor antagonist
MEILQEKENDIVILSLQGRLDALTSPALEKRMLDLIAENERHIVVDFAQLDLISSAGLRVFLTAMKQLKTVHGKLILCALNQYVREVFDVSGMAQLFRIFSSKDEAKQNLQ